MTTYYIYTLVNSENEEVFYVGCTINPKQRLKQHTSNTGAARKTEYVQSASSFKMCIVDKVEARTTTTLQHPKKVKSLEKSWIYKYLEEGHPIVNKERFKEGIEMSKLTMPERKCLKRLISKLKSPYLCAAVCNTQRSVLDRLVKGGIATAATVDYIRLQLQTCKYQ